MWFRNGIIPAASPGMARWNAFYTQPKTSQCSVPRKCLDGISTAGWLVAATGWQIWRNSILVKSNESNKKMLHINHLFFSNLAERPVSNDMQSAWITGKSAAADLAIKIPWNPCDTPSKWPDIKCWWSLKASLKSRLHRLRVTAFPIFLPATKATLKPKAASSKRRYRRSTWRALMRLPSENRRSKFFSPRNM